MSENNMKLICEYPAGTLRNAITSSNVNTVAMGLRVMPGIGKPFLIFPPTAYQGAVAMADFDMYPDYVVSADVSENLALINAMMANPPLDAITLAT